MLAGHPGVGDEHRVGTHARWASLGEGGIISIYGFSVQK